MKKLVLLALCVTGCCHSQQAEVSVKTMAFEVTLKVSTTSIEDRTQIHRSDFHAERDSSNER